MAWPMIALALGSAALGLWNQEQLAQRQDRQAAATIRNQAKKQETADARIAQALTAQAASNPADELAQQTNAYIQTLQQGQQRGGFNTGPGAYSDAYLADVEAAQQGVDQYGRDRAGLIARIDAPALQRQNEGILFDNLRAELGMIGREARGQDYLDTLKLKNLRANPWIDALSQAGMGYAMGAAGGGSTAGAASGGATGFGNNMDEFMRIGWGY